MDEVFPFTRTYVGLNHNCHWFLEHVSLKSFRPFIVNYNMRTDGRYQTMFVALSSQGVVLSLTLAT
jgi:hypothetical protein